jgi:hypothetical protein
METNKILAIIIALVSGFYLLPTAVAIWQNHPQTMPIFLVNLLLGWTVVGWIIALVWSLR